MKKRKKIENWEGKIYDFLSPINLTMFREERTEKVISFVKELLKSEREKWSEKILKKMKCRKRHHEDQLCGGCNDCNTYQKLKEEIKNKL